MNGVCYTHIHICLCISVIKSALFRHWLKVSASLVVIMGISWIIGVLTFHEALLFVSYIFTIIVAFQVLRLFVQLWSMYDGQVYSII